MTPFKVYFNNNECHSQPFSTKIKLASFAHLATSSKPVT